MAVFVSALLVTWYLTTRHHDVAAGYARDLLLTRPVGVAPAGSPGSAGGSGPGIETGSGTGYDSGTGSGIESRFSKNLKVERARWSGGR